MNYVCTLLAVKDIEKSKKFYHDILDQYVVCDLGANVTLTGGFALQTADSWGTFIQKSQTQITYGNNDAELYFEEDDMHRLIEKLAGFDIEYVHPLKEHAWGQHVVRFYDPDKHIIEVGENMVMVVRKFMEDGLSAEETAIRMDVPVDYVKSCIE
ncbi:MAG: glyoxalase [Clostridiales bacterium]|nr:glyoxalase [Clostridiales bacterium]